MRVCVFEKSACKQELIHSKSEAEAIHYKCNSISMGPS